jgi:hypothetical protein
MKSSTLGGSGKYPQYIKEFSVGTLVVILVVIANIILEKAGVDHLTEVILLTVFTSVVLVLILIVLISFERHIRHTLDERLKSIPQYFTSCNDVADEIEDMLLHARNSVYYFGAAGFLTFSKPYHNLLNKKIMKDGLRFVRVLDLQTVKEMSEHDHFRPEDLERYKRWLKAQETFLSGHNNFELWDSRSYPIWGTGNIVIVVDNTEILNVFTTLAPNDSAVRISSIEYGTLHIESWNKVIHQGSTERIKTIADLSRYYAE